MALTISQNDNTIILKGTLNTANINNLKKHIGFILKSYKNVTIDINKLKSIDHFAITVLKNLYKNAALNRKPFFVIGKRSDAIRESFKFN